MSINKITPLLFAVSVAAIFSYCSSSRKMSLSSPNQVKGLKDYYKDYFLIGAAVTPNSLKGEDSALIVNHFNSITAENAMKMGPIHPMEKEYYWKMPMPLLILLKNMD